ncbi:unnamed protein product [marine sediment metagenome]|uniref:Uncharacterized protein n=1 Tax=marine sediment metagenome TaxID=412755 RepID=X1RRV0_9ZZZZ
MLGKFIELPITTDCSGKYPVKWDKKLEILYFYDESIEKYIQLYDCTINVGEYKTKIEYTGILEYV